MTAPAPSAATGAIAPDAFHPSEFLAQIANSVSLEELMEQTGALFNASDNKWRTAEGHIIQTRGSRWYDFRHAKGGLGPISLAQFVYGAKNPAEACQIIESACPGPFLAAREKQEIAQSAQRPQSPPARLKGGL